MPYQPRRCLLFISKRWSACQSQSVFRQPPGKEQWFIFAKLQPLLTFLQLILLHKKYPKCKPSSYPNVIQCQCAMIILTSAKMYCTYTKDVWALLQHKGMSIPDNSETTNVTLSLIWDWGKHFQAATNSSHARSEPGAPPALCAGSHLAPAIRVIWRASVKVIVAHFSRWGHPLLVWT